MNAQALYRKHKQRSGRLDRNGNLIEFKLTFEDWLKIWMDSGHWEDRGRGEGKYVMSRVGDIGHYEVGNVFIQPHSQNVIDGLKDRPKTNEHRARIGASQVGMKHTALRTERQAASLAKHPPVTCPHCGKTGHVIVMPRWHFDNCKSKSV